MELGLRGATIAVTGASEGMGRATAEWLAKDGARVAVLARTKEAVEKAAEALRALGSPDAIGISVDVSDTASVEAGFAEIGRRWGELNALINTVGPSLTGTIDELTDEQWRASLEVGTFSAVRCVRAALPLLRKAEWARIVNVSAHSTKRQAPTLIAYTAAQERRHEPQQEPREDARAGEHPRQHRFAGDVPDGRRAALARRAWRRSAASIRRTSPI